jgi:putative oxidoreductase
MNERTVMEEGVRTGGGGLRPAETAAERPIRQGGVRAASRWVQLLRRLKAYDRNMRQLLGRASPILLRISLAVVFVWFGALKVAGVSAVGGLVAATVPFLDSAWFVPVLGIVEILVGVAFATGRLLRVVLPVFAAHMAGTFLVLITLPDVAFQGANPLVLTAVGEFVVKNLVLLTAGLVVASGVKPLGAAAGGRGATWTD